jgi:hypothetical protein
VLAQMHRVGRRVGHDLLDSQRTDQANIRAIRASLDRWPPELGFERAATLDPVLARPCDFFLTLKSAIGRTSVARPGGKVWSGRQAVLWPVTPLSSSCSIAAIAKASGGIPARGRRHPVARHWLAEPYLFRTLWQSGTGPIWGAGSHLFPIFLRSQLFAVLPYSHPGLDPSTKVLRS